MSQKTKRDPCCPCSKVEPAHHVSNHSDGFRFRSGLPFNKTILVWVGICTCLGVFVPDPSFAGAMDWLSHKRSDSKSTATVKAGSEKATVPAADLPSFFKTEALPDTTGSSLPLMKFVESHWLNAKKNLELVTKGIAGKIPARRCNDISEKLLVIDTQIVKECLKNSAAGIEKLTTGTKNLQTIAEELNRIITAPREETMENLEKTIAKLQGANEQVFRTAKGIICGADSLIKIANETFQTLELIPLLSINPVDFYVQGSKQLMKQVRSDNEALKGMVLNVQSSCEQTLSSLELMLSTLKSTLRYSDHFAFKQYPLINLPVPTREKLFSQLGALQNVVKGIDNTLSISNSHVKNSAQQFSHVFEGVVAKIRDALQYMTAVDVSTGNLPQISVYAQNQISGLYQRTKDGIAEMKLDIAKVIRSGTFEGAPQVSLENGEDETSRRASTVADSKLPLFLLGGGKGDSGKTANLAKAPGSTRPGSGETTVLYTEKKPAEPPIQGLRQDEMDLLQKEFGSALGPMQAATPKTRAGDEESLDFSQEQKGADNDVLQSFNPMPSYPTGRLAPAADEGEKVARNSDPSSDKGELEMLPIDNAATQDSGDLIPMLRMDEPLGSPDKE